MYEFNPLHCSNCINADEPMVTMLCPTGHICDMEKKRQANCSLIRQNYVKLGFGDVLGGVICPGNGTNTMKNCPIGYYCPDPNTSIICPEGFFCPHRSADYTIQCRNCSSGSESLKRNFSGYIVCIVISLLLGIYVLYKTAFVRRFRQEQDLEIRGKRNAKDLEKTILNPFLKDLSDRIDHSVTWNHESWEHFNVKALYDYCNSTNIHEVSYDELNQIMHLDTNQLNLFRLTINEKAGLDRNSSTVSEPVFVRFFFEAMMDALTCWPSTVQIIALFYEVLESDSSNHELESINIRRLYDSSISYALSEQQIGKLLRYLRRSIHPPTIHSNDETTSTLATVNSPSHLDISSSSMESDNCSSEVAEAKIERRFKNNLRSMLCRRCQYGSSINCIDTISKDDFVRFYPEALRNIVNETVNEMEMDMEGIDIFFENLSLEVISRGKTTTVVDRVSGRIRQGAMTALMGCSGAGKTSLLNALCGRAYYGNVRGTIKVNGCNTGIENLRDAIGFVPQDDVLYAELTVIENLLFAGKFRLPRGTSSEVIRSIAEEILSSLGLTRVAHTIVGSVSKRGVSGGEKKRLNIGVEMMAKPAILFLDEPTSGLDSNCALQVMKALKALVRDKGVTVCTAIHQPRKVIFELFDSLILLGLGGRILYQGSTIGAAHYFLELNYVLPPSESVADWLLDISSGHLLSMNCYKDVARDRKSRECEAVTHLYRAWEQHLQSLSSEDLKVYSAPDTSSLPTMRVKVSFCCQLTQHIIRNFIVIRRNAKTKCVDTAIIVGGILLVAIFVGEFKPTKDIPLDVRNSFEVFTSMNRSVCSQAMPDIFNLSAFSDCRTFAVSVSAITSTLLALTASKAITEKREQFFRDVASGYSINPFFLAINISSTTEQCIQVLLASVVAFWLRNSLCHWTMYAVNFLFLGWISVSWGLFFAITVPPKNVVLVIGFFMLFGSLLLSGVSPPIVYNDIYSNKVIAVLSGLFSPTRYFIEALVVSEYRVLAPQYGFSVDNDFIQTFPMEKNMFVITRMAQNNFPRVALFLSRNKYGWFWGIAPSFFVGLTVRLAANLAMISCHRSKQVKGSIRKEFGASRSFRISFIGLLSAFCLSLGTAVVTILK